MEVNIKLSDRPDKRYQAVFYDRDKKVKPTYFGFAMNGEGGKKQGSTSIDHKNDTLKMRG